MTAVPVRDKDTDEVGADACTDTDPARLPAATGAYVTVKVQPPLAATETGADEVPQVFALKETPVPETEVYAPVAGPVPLLVSVKLRVWVLFTITVPKAVSLTGLSDSAADPVGTGTESEGVVGPGVDVAFSPVFATFRR